MTRFPSSIRFVLFALWLAVAVFLAIHHTFWRDEVRALTIALQGSNVFAMLAGLHGEGHPALWYLLLRGAHALVPRREVLPAVALLVAAASSLVFVLRSPFHWLAIALILATAAMTFEYAVMARNYGISMLLLFVIAACYERYRTRGIVLGVLLALLANTNVHSAVLVVAFLLFWLIDIAREQGLRPSPQLRTFALNAAVAVVGIVLCIVTVYPPFNDAAELHTPLTAGRLATAMFDPGVSFAAILQRNGLVWPLGPYAGWPLSLVLFGSTVVLVRRPGAFAAAVAALVGLSLVFTFVYPGSYRHAALYLVFLIALWWIAAARERISDGAPRVRRLGAAGGVFAIVLLAMQLPWSAMVVTAAVRGGPPFSRSADLGALIAGRPDLHDAILIAEPDYLLDAMPYYVSNPLYFMREQRFGTFVRFTTQERRVVGLSDILATAQWLHRTTSRPVVIVLAARIDLPRLTMLGLSYDGALHSDLAGVQRFVAATTPVAHFGPALSRERYDVYTLKY